MHAAATSASRARAGNVSGVNVDQIRKLGDPVLHTRCHDCPTGPVTVAYAERMMAVMHAADGVGLAANQIGRRARLFVAEYEGRVFHAVNPTIVEWSDKLVTAVEGCLSIPGRQFEVARPEWVVLEGLTPAGEPFRERFDGWWARIICHETDHLAGKTIATTGRRV